MTMKRPLAEILPVQAGGARVLGLHYNGPSRTLAVRVGEEHWRFRLFIRSVDVATYREVLPLGSGREYRAIVDAESAPLMFALEANSQGSCVVELSLPLGQARELPPANDAESYRVWVSSLLRASADGRTVLVIAACGSTPTPDGGQSIDYFVAQMSTETGALSKIALLDSPYA